MKLVSAAKSYDGVTLRQVALVAGLPVSYGEFSVYPKLVVASNAGQTVQNISGHLGLLLPRSSVTSSASSATLSLPGRSTSCSPR